MRSSLTLYPFTQDHAALGSLDDVSRTAVVLRYYEDLSSKEIGEILGVSAAAIDTRLSRARDELRRTLAPLMPEPATTSQHL